ncbi:hypothetical protein [Fructilactobacillus florum]|uniref:hypothetical protein n=1 Tax=Fructilactobacillus florum TaxID=640331 RepID=UPI0006D08B19|nr:hypothetical protein [Fructilactobacillus florum]
MDDTAILELHRKVAEEVAEQLLVPIAKNLKLKYAVIDTKLAQEISRQSTTGWSEIAGSPELRAIEHHKKNKNGNYGRSIYYYPDEFYKALKDYTERVWD